VKSKEKQPLPTGKKYMIVG